MAMNRWDIEMVAEKPAQERQSKAGKPVVYLSGRIPDTFHADGEGRWLSMAVYGGGATKAGAVREGDTVMAFGAIADMKSGESKQGKQYYFLHAALLDTGSIHIIPGGTGTAADPDHRSDERAPASGAAPQASDDSGSDDDLPF